MMYVPLIVAVAIFVLAVINAATWQDPNISSAAIGGGIVSVVLGIARIMEDAP